jgi:hypothetical protein
MSAFLSSKGLLIPFYGFGADKFSNKFRKQHYLKRQALFQSKFIFHDNIFGYGDSVAFFSWMYQILISQTNYFC